MFTIDSVNDLTLTNAAYVRISEALEALTGAYGGQCHYMPRVNFVWREDDLATLGVYRHSSREDGRIELNLAALRTLERLLSTAVHEAVHHAQNINGWCAGAGDGFPPDFPWEEARRARRDFEYRRAREGTYQDNPDASVWEPMAFWVQATWGGQLTRGRAVVEPYRAGPARKRR